MAKEVLERWMPSNLAELRDVLLELDLCTMREAPDPTTVYVDLRDLALVKETLTDGSVVFNVVVRENK